MRTSSRLRGVRFPFLFLSTLCLLIACLPTALGLQQELAGIVDWHKPLIGEPLLEPTPPLFVEGKEIDGGRVVQLTKKNLLAVLNAENGEIVWRQALEDNDPVVSFHVQDDTILLLSGPSASSARLFSLTTGHLLWHAPLLPLSQSHLITPVHLGTDAAYVPAQASEPASWLVLSDGKRITRLRSDKGDILWSMESPAAGSNMVFKQIMPSGNSVHILALHYSFAVQSLLTSTIALDKPIPRADFGQVPSVVQIPEQAIIASSHEPGAVRVVWIDHGRIRSLHLNEDGSLGEVKEILPGKGRLYGSIIDVGLRHKGYILGKREDGAVEILDVRDGKKVEEFELSKDSPERSDSVYSAAVTKRGVLVNRVYWSYHMGVGVVQSISIPASATSEVITSGFTFAFDDLAHGVILHAAVSPSVNEKHLPSLILITSSKAIQRMQFDGAQWTREESLADVTAVKFVDLGEPEVEEVREVLDEEGFGARLVRHLGELKDLPAYLVRFTKRFTSASYTSALRITPLNQSNLHRDQFGFQKLVVLSTHNGKLFAIDSSNGATVWTRNLGLMTEKGSEVKANGMWIVRQHEGGVLLAVLATKTVGKRVRTVTYHVDAYTGRVSGDVNPRTGLPEGTTLFEGTSREAFLTPFENCGSKSKVLGVVDDKERLHLWPGCKKVTKTMEEEADKLFFTTTTKSIEGTAIQGFTPSAAPVDEDSYIYTSNLICFGRVLGDKSTLYKYLNPHLLIVSTFTPSTKGLNPVTQEEVGIGRVYVLDTISGETIIATEIDGVVKRGMIHVAMVENWLVYTWLAEGGYRIGSIEIYEDTEKKGVTPAVSSFVSKQVKTFAQTFIIPSEIKALGFTTSKAGITTKELIFVNNRNQIISIPRRLLDPRRPMGKPTSRDKEEMLIPYDNMIPIDTRKIISHKYQVQGTTSLLSSPALVESTSLLLAYGQDLFLTRGLTPSGTFDILSDNFNKIQLLLTLGGLSAGIFVARPAVKRKWLRMKWY
ncbi:endoplasmic reticulum protein [Cryptococcus deuterogattii 2001/935-1]|nr:endoplasmic reticulum protein [Cryptococcus deuterogattii 2001/935-1]